jgi:hypothetical protein
MQMDAIHFTVPVFYYSLVMVSNCFIYLSSLRLRLGIRPGRYGNMDGTKRIYYDNLARLEGVD